MKETEPKPKYLLLDGGSYEFHKYECGHLLIVTPAYRLFQGQTEIHRHPCPECGGHV